MKKLVTICAVAVVLFAVPAMASYTIEHSHSQGVGYANISFDGGASTVNSYLGRFIMEPITPLPLGYPIYSISTVHGPENGFFTYCLEPTQSNPFGHGPAYQKSYSIDTLAGTDGIDAGDAALIGELLSLYNPLLQNDPTGPYTGGTFRTAAAALELAIWKINLDRATETLGAWDFSSGLMRIAAGAVGVEIPDVGPVASLPADVVALTMLNSLDGTGPMAYGLEGLRNPDVQDLIIQVPEPATMSILGLGAMALLRKRK